MTPIHLIDATHLLSISLSKQIRLKKVEDNVFCPSCVQTSWPPRGDARSERPGNPAPSRPPRGEEIGKKANVLTPLLHNSITPKGKAFVFNSLASETSDNSFNFFDS